MVIRIVLNKKKEPPWKLADASLVFTEDDDPLLAGLVLSGFTIGASRFPSGEVNITLPSRKYQIMGSGGTREERTWNYLRAAHPEDQDALITKLLEAIRDAYTDALGRKEDP